MGVKEKIDQADVIVKYGGKIISACGTRSNRFLFCDAFRITLFGSRPFGSHILRAVARRCAAVAALWRAQAVQLD